MMNEVCRLPLRNTALWGLGEIVSITIKKTATFK